jgi:energy-coupling factor transport system substrate-specific component
LATVGRTIFAGIPSFQPASFIIIMTGIILGAKAGWITGAATAIVSNIFLGQGPWTIFQTLAWGLMGLSSGLLAKILKNKSINIIYAFLWGFLFGFITDIWTILMFVKPITFMAILGVNIAAIPYNLIHGLCNSILVFLFSERFTKIFERLDRKYGIKNVEF